MLTRKRAVEIGEAVDAVAIGKSSRLPSRSLVPLLNENGQALVLVLLGLALGTLLVSGFLFFASTSQRATTAVLEQTVERYSADAGVEDAIWKLQNQPGFTQTVILNGPVTYTLTINGQTVVVTVTNAMTP